MVEMTQFGWENCPQPTRTQVEKLVASLRSELGDNLLGIYLHGSLALGCFNPGRSDLDLLAVTRREMTAEEKRRILQLLLLSSGSPHPIEISFLTEAQLVPWKHPTPYDLHYSEDWRKRYERLLVEDEPLAQKTEQRDPDLAAHVTITRRRGIRLYGKPIEAVFPEVPRADYMASIIDDFYWAKEGLLVNPVYFVLNACRIYAYMKESSVLSKEEAGMWALSTLPNEYRPLIIKALAAYRGHKPEPSLDAALLAAFATFITERLV
jgi:predicted nucleotidyltransferase